jgi:hypothetical protein
VNCHLYHFLSSLLGTPLMVMYIQKIKQSETNPASLAYVSAPIQVRGAKGAVRDRIFCPSCLIIFCSLLFNNFSFAAMSPLASNRRKRRCCILSPSTKRIRKAIGKEIQAEAFKELLKLKAAGQGRLQYGEMKRLVKKYNGKGYPEVTRDNLNYRLKKLEEDHEKKDAEAKSIQLAAERTLLIGIKVVKIWWLPQRLNKSINKPAVVGDLNGYC